MIKTMPLDPSPEPYRSGLPLRSLTADVAHELSNQLGCLVLLPDLMLDALPPDSPLVGDLQQIRRAAQRIDELSTHLSLLSLDRNEREPVNLNLAVDRAAKADPLATLLADTPGTHVTLTCEEYLSPVFGSAEWMAIITGNLIRNAIDAKPGGTIRVSTSARPLAEDLDGWERVPQGDYAVLSVSDQAPGLSPTQRAKLFEPYFTNTMGRRSMSGLGMAVVRQLARRQGAWIDVRSDLPGTTIDIFFPTVLKADENLEEKTRHDRVLVVDDREEQRNVISRILRSQGYRVSSVAGGPETLAHLEGPGTDLIVLDISLRRDREGLDLHAQIRSRWPSLKILLMSGHPREVYADVLGRAGDCPFLKKPFRSEELLAAADSLLPAPARPTP